MYNTKYKCIYNDANVFIETDDVDDNTKDKIKDMLYRNDFLYIFGIEEYDDIYVEKSLTELHIKLQKSIELCSIMKKISNLSFMVEDEMFGLMILYSFDYLYITHVCVSEFLETGKISETNLNELEKQISATIEEK